MILTLSRQYKPLLFYILQIQYRKQKTVNQQKVILMNKLVSSVWIWFCNESCISGFDFKNRIALYRIKAHKIISLSGGSKFMDGNFFSLPQNLLSDVIPPMLCIQLLLPPPVSMYSNLSNFWVTWANLLPRIDFDFSQNSWMGIFSASLRICSLMLSLLCYAFNFCSPPQFPCTQIFPISELPEPTYSLA